MLEATMHALRHPADAERDQRTKRRLGRQRAAKVAQIDLARKLTEAIWHMLTTTSPSPPPREAPPFLWPPDRPFGLEPSEPASNDAWSRRRAGHREMSARSPPPTARNAPTPTSTNAIDNSPSFIERRMGAARWWSTGRLRRSTRSSAHDCQPTAPVGRERSSCSSRGVARMSLEVVLRVPRRRLPAYESAGQQVLTCNASRR
jgi:hypothetical protein